MISRGIRQAVHADREQIAQLWITCFSERRAAVDYFLDNVFAGEDCLVHIEDGDVVAMVHMLPAHLAAPDGRLQAHYIYAAATHPDFRSRGLMGKLLAEAFSYGEKRGDVCSFLLPSEPSLYDYYGRHGYVPYFRTRFAKLDVRALDLERKGSERNEAKDGFSLGQPEQAVLLRDMQFAEQTGSVIWPARYLDYAAQINGIYGGQSTSLWGENGDIVAYALYTAPEAGQVEVGEVVATDDCWQYLLNHVARTTGADRLSLRLAEHSHVLPGVGESRIFGMARPLGGFVMPATAAGRSPYLGLTLD